MGQTMHVPRRAGLRPPHGYDIVRQEGRYFPVRLHLHDRLHPGTTAFTSENGSIVSFGTRRSALLFLSRHHDEKFWGHAQGTYESQANVPVAEGVQNVTVPPRIAHALHESEEQFRRLVETYAQAVWETNADGEVVKDSPSWRTYTGQTFEEWIGYGWVNAIHPDDREYAERQWREAIVAKRNVDAEFRLKYANNGYRWTNVRVIPFFADDGSIVKWVGMNIDIHDRMLAEERYRLLFESIDQGANLCELIRDEKGNVFDLRVLQVNAAWEKIVGIKPETIIGKSVAQWLPNLESGWLEMYERVVRTGHPERDELWVGDLGWWLEVFVSPLGEDRFMTLFSNITERRQMEQALRDSEQRVLAERQRLYDLFMQAPAAIQVMKGPKHVYELLNPLAVHYLGEHRSYIGLPGREAVPEAEEQGFFDLLDTVYQTGTPFIGNEVPAQFHNNDDGTTEHMYFNFVYQPLYNTSGEVEGVLGYSNNITETVLARQRVEESEERLRTLANSMPQLVWSANAEGEIDFYNERVSEYAEMPRNEDGSYQWQASVHPESRETATREWESVVRAEHAFELERRLHMKDGTYRWHLVRGVPVHDEDGSISRWYGTKTDIEHLKQLEQQRTDFLGVVSHELKTPVTSVKAFAEVLENRFRKAGDETSASLLGKMNAQMEKLTRLISDLLDVTKIEAGKLHFHEEFFPFDTLVDDILEEVQRTTTHTLQREGTTSVTVCGDRERIGQVLINLLTNAIKYSPNASKVVVSRSCSEQEVTLCVRDFGIGIAGDKVPHVFERFFRETGAREDTFAGLGLGLYVASEIISRQGGRLWVESEKGHGSTFCFSLPVGGNNNTRRSTDMFAEGK